MWRVLFFVCLCAPAPVRGYVHRPATDVHVRVNRVHVQGVDVREGSVEEHAQYPYAVGDFVDVWCVRWWATCALSLRYQLDGSFGNNGSITDNFMETKHSLLQLSTRLTAAHDGGLVSCECTHGLHNFTIHLKLVLRESLDDVLQVTVNSKALSNVRELGPGPSQYSVSYAYKRHETITLQCGTNLPDVQLYTFKNLAKESTTQRQFVLSPDVLPRYELWRLTCVARNVTTNTKLCSVNVYLSPFYLRLGETHVPALTMNTSGSLLELSGPREQIIYYEYDNDEALYFNCSTTSGILRDYKYTLVFGGKVKTNEDSIIGQPKLSYWDHNTTMNCSLLNNTDNATVSNIRLLLRRRQATSDSVGGDENSQNITIVIGAACVAVAGLIVGAVAVLCRRYRRTGAAGRPPPSLKHRPLPQVPGKLTNSKERVNAGILYREIATMPPAVPDETSGSYDYVYCHMNAYCELPAVQPPSISEDPTQVYEYAYGRVKVN